MNLKFAFPIAAAATLLAMCLAAPHPTGITEIRLERQACYGTCPIYIATLRSDGTLTYEGKGYVPRMGHYKAKVPPYVFDRLPPLVDRLGFYKLQSRYAVTVTDQPTQIVTVVKGDVRTKVEEYGQSGPPELWALETIIDAAIADAYEWQKVKLAKKK